MIHSITTVMSPTEAFVTDATLAFAAKACGVAPSDISAIAWRGRNIDSRRFPARVNAQFDVYIGEQPAAQAPEFAPRDVANAPQVHIVGAGPAGYFAALELIALGFKPIVLERGKEVSARKVDVATLSRNRGLEPDSNYAFGEGGAGTFSDGKLFTRGKRRDDIRRALRVFVQHGAQPDILVDAHPHVGSDVLPQVVRRMRQSIEAAGGQVLFGHKVTGIELSGGRVDAVTVDGAGRMPVQRLVLAAGHSARDIYQMLHQSGVELQAKGFAMGVRVEHPQEFINAIQYHTPKYDPALPPATYTLKRQVAGRGAYSFCMCPGGFIVPATTDAGLTVVNGMSNSRRNSPFANSGFVVELRPADFEGYGRGGVFAGLDYQADFERLAYINGGNGQIAPAQRMHDFVKGRVSPELRPCGYAPGVMSSPLHLWMPDLISGALRKAFADIGRFVPGYLTNDALVVGVESRTSSPVRVPRDPATMASPSAANLYPCGEGAGYAGGIVSSAVDGMLAARAVAASLA